MNDESNFIEIEKEFRLLKKQYRLNRITRQEYKQRLKELRIKDRQGRCWTLGARTGKWYYFDGEKWVESQPPSLNEQKAICIYCGYENDLSNEVCQYCGSELNEKKSEANSTSILAPEKEPQKPFFEEGIRTTTKTNLEKNPTSQLVIKGIHPLTFTLFWGIIGTFLGMIIGIILGVMNLPLTLIARWPAFFQNIQGNLYGGILFGLGGAVLGMIGFSLLGLLIVSLINIGFNLLGGLPIRGKWQ